MLQIRANSTFKWQKNKLSKVKANTSTQAVVSMPQENYTKVINVLKESTTFVEEFLCAYSNGGKQDEQNNKIFSTKYLREAIHASRTLHGD